MKAETRATTTYLSSTLQPVHIKPPEARTTANDRVWPMGRGRCDRLLNNELDHYKNICSIANRWIKA